MNQVVVLELNELNFEGLKFYVDRGELPNFRRFFAEHGYCETTSETRYAELEPWIQWVTVHTGQSFSEHGIFRLGDAVASGVPQIWERLERDLGLTVGAVSPMNAANRLARPAFFIPDPWTPTPPTGSWLARRLSVAISRAVNDNAGGKLTIGTTFVLLLGVLRYARPANYLAYLRLVLGLAARPWNKVAFLDLFLSDFFAVLNRATGPQFSTLFLNGAAHLQHHYLANSPAYGALGKNPDWYMKPDKDPVGDIYRSYDHILGSVRRALPGQRILLITGLHQKPYPVPKFYWRLRNHAAFLRQLGLKYREVQPRMSRDFVVTFDSPEDQERIKAVLLSARIDDEIAFAVEDRGKDMFVELVFPRDITSAMALTAGGTVIPRIRDHVFFVALKNGHHDGIGYFSDSGRQPGQLPNSMPLTRVYDEIVSLFDARLARPT